MEGKTQQALSAGSVDIRVKRAGMYQVLTFKLVRHKTPSGEVPYLTLEKFLDLSELVRIAEEYQLPVESPVGKVYPRGKREADFAGL